MKDANLLEVENLSVSFRTDEGRLTAVHGVSFSVPKGRTLGIVGESGSGKSVATRALMQLLPQNARMGADTRIRYRRKDGSEIGVETLARTGEAVRQLRGGEIAMVFQEPMASFSPVWTIGNQMIEAILLHRNVGKAEAREIAVGMLDKAGISNPELRLNQFAHELSGGMRQRAMIATALATSPALLIADEPTTALDVTIQAQILALLKDLQRDLGMSVIFITHDLGVIAHVADEVAVMYLGQIVERGTTGQVIHSPKHPYTRGLLAALPDRSRPQARLVPVPGDIPSPMERPAGCPFHTRCDSAMPGACDTRVPAETDLGSGHKVSCLLYGAEHG